MKLLDCTLRDGGYYTNWEFSDDFVKMYMNALKYAGVNYVEFGYRFFQNTKQLSQFPIHNFQL